MVVPEGCNLNRVAPVRLDRDAARLPGDGSALLPTKCAVWSHRPPDGPFPNGPRCFAGSLEMLPLPSGKEPTETTYLEQQSRNQKTSKQLVCHCFRTAVRATGMIFITTERTKNREGK